MYGTNRSHDPNVHRRRSTRLEGYDYSQAGAYFVTVVTQDRQCLFGEVRDYEMLWNEAGEMVRDVWKGLPNRFPNMKIDDFVVMPNHIHGIVEINDVGAPLVGALLSRPEMLPEGNGATTRVAPTLGAIVGAFKSLTTVRYTRGVRTNGWPAFLERLWQRNYYEHIVRNNDSHDRIRDYIFGNPANWTRDQENPLRLA